MSTSLLLVVALIAGVVAFVQRNHADRQATRARASSIDAEVDRIVAELPAILPRDRSLGTLLAVEVDRLRPSPTTRAHCSERSHGSRTAVHTARRPAGYASLGVYRMANASLRWVTTEWTSGTSPPTPGRQCLDRRRRRAPAGHSQSATTAQLSPSPPRRGRSSCATRDAPAHRSQRGSGGPVDGLAFAPDRRQLAIAVRRNGRLCRPRWSAVGYRGKRCRTHAARRTRVPLSRGVQPRTVACSQPPIPLGRSYFEIATATSSGCRYTRLHRWLDGIHS